MAEAVELLLKYIKEYKSKCEFNGVDFEADLSSMYTEVRRCLAVDFPNDFGPEFCHNPGKDLKDRVRVLQKKVRRREAKNQTWISKNQRESEKRETGLPQRSKQRHQERQRESGAG